MRARGTSPVVGVVLLVAIVVVLIGSVGTAAMALSVDGESTPRLAVTAPAVDAADAWPRGQRLRLTHDGGDPLAVERLTLVVSVGDRRGRVGGFPRRRITTGSVAGDELFDNGYAGVDGELDAAHTDGAWEPGESLEIRLAREDVDLRAGDSVAVRLLHDDATVATVDVPVR